MYPLSIYEVNDHFCSLPGDIKHPAIPSLTFDPGLVRLAGDLRYGEYILASGAADTQVCRAPILI